ncbi:hypothetical protein RS83_01674 [Microbacterium oxydans]|uniref:Uncharacterized protein n=1 Tax=Microbacterium oxydans TaxID=82380 RepID=A0A0F0L8X3_9MICO|nr:hypothetical protein RS83_01674 [Microbacterium oxydans]
MSERELVPLVAAARARLLAALVPNLESTYLHVALLQIRARGHVARAAIQVAIWWDGL